MSDWRACGLEKCLVCGGLYPFNPYYFKVYFEQELGDRQDMELICRFCLGESNTFEEAPD